MVCAAEKDDHVATPPPRVAPEGPTTEQAHDRVDVAIPESSDREGLEFIDEPDETEDPHGYGHGV
jgi:DNA polymerase III sliding clamp (beta) subunit (PCNA family)